MSATISARILGLTVDIDPGVGVAGRVIRDELSVYPPASGPADLHVRVVPQVEGSPLAANPSTHVEYDDGFAVRYGMATVRYRFEGERCTAADVAVHTPASRMWGRLQKWADMQFASREERAGMILHELALVPAAALTPGLAPLHASALGAPEAGVTLFGGTGGVGKTSLELELGVHGPYAFVADDVALLDTRGQVYPNLAYPKVYGYNLEAAPSVQAAVLGGRSLADRLHWRLHAARGLSHVRRRIPPGALYDAVRHDPQPAERYILLFRETVDHLAIEELPLDQAVATSVDVLRTELGTLLHHLRFHQYNRRLLGREPIVSPEAVADGWHETLTQALAGVPCQIARIPVGMNHEAFKRAMRESLLQTASG
ncbi:MAG: hypothetical protein AAF845_00985 [Bacteroidota bacterium]